MWRRLPITLTLLLCTSLAPLWATYVNTRDICNRNPSETAALKADGDNGFRIKIAGNPEKYTAEQVYTVSIDGTYSNQNFIGFMLVAVPQNARDESTAMGTFQHMSGGLTKFAEPCPHIVTHAHPHAKSRMDIMWTAPPAGTGCVELRATVIEFNDIWYKNDGALSRLLCENTGVSEQNAQAEMVADCCACGVGKYQLTFEGIWSRQSHPKHFPQHKRLLHWSNIVGSSHSKRYTLWEYGGYASKGVKDTCEYGYPRSLEREMRLRTRDVRTVIKTPGIWWSEPEGLRQSRWARFSTDRKHHLLSMITMFGPSPDWCVGVSGLNLCLPNCTWAGDMDIDMLPWDAGTDDGVTFMSRNKKSEPQQKIHHITNTFPNNPSAPFYGARSIKPLAVLRIRRLHPTESVVLPCDGTNEPAAVDTSHTFGTSARRKSKQWKLDEAVDDDDLTDEQKERLLLGPRDRSDCSLTGWSEWSECSATCDFGQRTRTRQHSTPADGSRCQRKLTDSESCRGVEQYCEKPQDVCSVTQWSEWSPCSVTCGSGVAERRRVYLKSSDELMCHRIMSETSQCTATVRNCADAHRGKNLTALCSLTKDMGPCRGIFSRWYYDGKTRRCEQFNYGGCRGNDNRFLTNEECTKTCAKSQNGSKKGIKSKIRNKKTTRIQRNKQTGANRVNAKNSRRRRRRQRCVMSKWSAWSSCSASCGKSYKFKRRTITQQPRNGGRKCPRRLERKRRCKTTKCPKKCTMSMWSEWTPCSVTCGSGGVQERTRRLKKSRPGAGECEEPTVMRRYCILEPCSVNKQLKRLRERIASKTIKDRSNE